MTHTERKTTRAKLLSKIAAEQDGFLAMIWTVDPLVFPMTGLQREMTAEREITECIRSMIMTENQQRALLKVENLMPALYASYKSCCGKGISVETCIRRFADNRIASETAKRRTIESMGTADEETLDVLFTVIEENQAEIIRRLRAKAKQKSAGTMKQRKAKPA